MKFCFFPIFALLAATLLEAGSDLPAAEGFTLIRTVGEVTEYTLDSNGLRVLLLPQKLAPVATFMVTYHVGSRNEVTGTTGATHLLEHLMFKGTEKFDRSQGTGFDQILERVGAETNATTWLDRTNYFATVPTNALPLLIEIEADRMRNLALREDDRRPEMTVVRNEFERGENSPHEALSKEIWASAFLAHPYHHETIGWLSDIERVPIEKLRAFYDTYYWPDNATVTVIGDFEPITTLAAIKKNYGVIPKSPHPFPQVYTEEPEQTGQRRVTVKRAGELGIVALAHKIPQATHADWPAIQMLSAILTSGKMSRCYRSLTDKNLTIDVSGSAGFNHDPSLHIISAMLNPGVKHEEVERGLVAEIEKIKKSGVTADEIKTARVGLLAQREYLRDGSFAQASEINECIAVGDWTLFFTLEEKLKAVTVVDVQRVAKNYLVEKRSVVGCFVPSDEHGSEVATPKSEHFEPKKVLPPKPSKDEFATASPNLEQRVVRQNIAGIDVLVCPTPVKGIVHLLASVPAGESKSSNRALAHLVAGMLERGTKKHDQFALAELLERVGATLEYNVGADTVDFRSKCLAANLSLVVAVLAEELREPAFSAAEFDKLKKELAGEVQQTLEDPEMQASIAFSRAVYPKGHPARMSATQELIAEIENAKLADVRAFYLANYGPVGMRMVAVGDLDAAAFQNATVEAFNGWKVQLAKNSAITGISPSIGEQVVINMPDKASVSVITGQSSGLRAGDPDWLALHVATQTLGVGFTSRLIGNVRDREGLTYGIGAKLGQDAFRTGIWQVTGTFASSLLDKGITSTRREIEDWWKAGITEDELAYHKSSMAGKFLVGLETTEGLAGQIMLCTQRGFDIKWLDDFPSMVMALRLEDVNAAIKKHLDPAKMTTVKAGTVK